MRSGKLTETIQVQVKTNEQDDYGELKNIFTTVFKTKADVRVLSGVDLIQAGIALTTEVASVMTRYNSRLKHEHFILWNGNRYEIGSIKPDGKKRDVIISISRQTV